MKPAVQWRPVPGYEGLYRVSSLGEIWSVTRTHTARHRNGKQMLQMRKAQRLSQYVDKAGYATVRLSRGGKVATLRVSRLVLLAFRGPAVGREAGHRDDNPGNNALQNLRWQTRAQNEKQKTRNGRRPESTRGLLTATLVRKMRKLRAAGYTYAALGQLFNCHLSTAAYACRGTTWTHV